MAVQVDVAPPPLVPALRMPAADHGRLPLAERPTPHDQDCSFWITDSVLSRYSSHHHPAGRGRASAKPVAAEPSTASVAGALAPPPESQADEHAGHEIHGTSAPHEVKGASRRGNLKQARGNSWKHRGYKAEGGDAAAAKVLRDLCGQHRTQTAADVVRHVDALPDHVRGTVVRLGNRLGGTLTT